MRKMYRIIIYFWVLLFPILCCGKIKNKENPESIARIACEGVGEVGDTFIGTKGAPIIILEENHTSRVGQIQHAITLVRLYERYGMRHIALEGYLKERSEIKTDWYISAAQGDSIARVRVAVNLLKEGEINCSEFIKLVYDDIYIHPVEITSEYSVELDDEASRAPTIYLLKIAQQSLRQEHVPKLKRLQNEMERLEGEDKQKKVQEYLDYIFSADTWTQSKAKIMQDPEARRTMSTEEQLALIEEIEEKARHRSVKLESSEIRAMERNIAFWRGRSSASTTMVRSTEEIADLPNVTVVPLVEGAAHTKEVCAMLRTANRPFAVVTPLSLKKAEEFGDLSWEQFERKYKKLSVYSEGFTRTLLKAFAQSKIKKPEPVLSEPWFQAKAELYLFTERISNSILGPPNPPGGGKPPYGFGDDDFKGNWIYINPKQIIIISDPEDKEEKTVLFPVILNPDDRKRRTQIWAKAGLVSTTVSARERENVETMLKEVLEKVRSEKEQSNKVEDKNGRIQVTINTTAVYKLSKSAATKASLKQV